ncbi:MAG: protein translocase subunit SecF [Terriglobia bacterium]
MELFREPKLDFLRWKWYLLTLSAILIIVSLSSLVSRGGPRYGVDFRGGTLVYLKFTAPPDLDRIRDGLGEQGLSSSTIQRYGRAQNHEMMIGLEQRGAEEEALDAGRQAILAALRSTFAVPSDKLDLNNVGTDTLRNALLRRDPLGLAPTPTAASERYHGIAELITDFRDQQKGGLIESSDELRALEGVPPAVVNMLEQQAFLSPFVVRNAEVVGPKVGRQLRQQTLMAAIGALGGVLLYIGIRFRQWVYGTAAVLAVFHDLLITVGFLSLFDYEFNLNIVAALLTLVGFSVNDTIVTFDRVRENVRLLRRERFAAIVNRSINQTLSRTVLTSGLTFMTVLALFFLGGEVLHGFAFTLVVGTLVGTYSSIFIASPIVVGWSGGSKG